MASIRYILSYVLLEHMPSACSYVYARIRERVISKSYVASLAKPQMYSEVPNNRNLAVNMHSKMLMIVTSGQIDSLNWRNAQGNYMYEIWASGKEYLGIAIDIFSFDEKANATDEFDRLLAYLMNGSYSHLLTSLESNPGATSWDWDYFALRAVDNWTGLVIGLSTDSVYRKHQIQFQRFINIYAETVIIGIDVVPDFKYVKSKHYFGPTLLPISAASISQIDKDLPDARMRLQSRAHDVVFVGAVYPYREIQLKKIIGQGLDLSINPHKAKLDEKESKGYVDFIAAMSSGSLTLNLARANGVKVKQLKSRALEGPVFGTPILSDEKHLTSIFFDVEKEFLYFDGSEKSVTRLKQLAKDKEMISNMSKSVKLKARRIAQSTFWNTVILASKELGQDEGLMFHDRET